MDQKDHKDVNNVNTGPIDSDSHSDDLDLTSFVLDDPNNDRDEKYGIY